MVERRTLAYRFVWWLALAALLQVSWPHVSMAYGQAIDAALLKQTGLALAPQDAAFFSTNLNLRTSWDTFLGGSFVTRLRGTAYVQRLESELLAQWESPGGQLQIVKDNLKNPNVKSLLELLVDMNSREIFYYGEHNWTESIEGLMGLYNDLNSRSNNPEAMQEFIAGLDAEYLNEISLPTTVVGFKLNNEEIARTLLDALQGALQLGLQQIPELAPLAKQIVRKDFKDGQVLSIALTTDLIPLSQLEPEVQELLEGVMAGLADRELVLSLGLRSKTLLISIGDGESPILTIGQGEKLCDHARMEVLLNDLPKDLRSVTFVSKEWRDSQWAANYGAYFENLAGQFTSAVSSMDNAEVENAEVDIEEWEDEIQEDAAGLDELISAYEVELDAALSWSFESEVGREGTTWDWSENVVAENAEPMTIVRHAGTQPLLLLAFKAKPQPLLIELLEEVIALAPNHLRKFVALAEQEKTQRDLALEVIEKASPIVEQLLAIMIDEIFPSIDENEGLLSLSAQWTTTELSLTLPPATRPLPLPEFGTVVKLRNRDQFLGGCSQLFEMFDKIVALVREVQPDSIPEGYEVPRPQCEELAGGSRFYYPEFSQGVPFEGFEPQVIVGNDIVIVGYSSRQVLDLLGEKPLATRPAWLSPEMPVASMNLMDASGMVTAVSPWIAYGIQATLGNLDSPLADGEGPMPTGNDIIQMWECLTALGKSAATSIIDDDGVTVSRWVWVGE